MTAERSERTPSRRDVLQALAGVGLAAPLALAAPAMAHAQDSAQVDYSGHPAVGFWISTVSGYPYAAHKFSYGITHADGTLTTYDPWVAHYFGRDLGLEVGDPTRLTMISGAWRPTGERTTESVGRFLWGDTTSTLLGTVRSRSRLGDDDDTAFVEYRITIVDAEGKVVLKDRGSTTAQRLQWEPFEEPITPEATPGA